MPTETELKLSFPPQFLDTIKKHPLLKKLSITEPENQYVHSTYYDTPDFTLGKKRIALRLRTIGNHWIQTIKSGGTVHDGLHQHHEFECALTENKLDLDNIPDAYLKHFFSDKQLRDKLHPIFSTAFQRTIYLLEPQENFSLECCIDDGVIIANEKTVMIYEIELELKFGEPSQLTEFSKLLQSQCSFDLMPENINKARRGYALLSE